MPVPRNKMQLDYSRWQQNLIGVLQVDIAYHSQIEIGDLLKYIYTHTHIFMCKMLCVVMHINVFFLFVAPRTKITLDARLAYRNKGDLDDDWKPYAASVVERILDCSIDNVNI